MRSCKIVIHILFFGLVIVVNQCFAEDITIQDSIKFDKLHHIQQKYLNWVDKKDRELPMGFPVVIGNKYDGVLLGAGLVNLKQPVKNIDFSGLLLYGLKSKKVSGVANLYYQLQPKNSIISNLNAGVHFKSFTYKSTPKALKYYTIAPRIDISFKSKAQKTKIPLEHQLSFVNNNILEQAYSYQTNSDTLYKFYANILAYSLHLQHEKYPSTFGIFIEQSKHFVKTGFEANSFIQYGIKNWKTGLHLRFFGGGFLYRDDDFRFGLNPQYGFNLSGKVGEVDYLYDGNYFGRNEQTGFASQQISANDGYFKVITAQNGVHIGQTVNYIFALNTVIDFPVPYVPIKLFFDLGYTYNNKLSNGNISDFPIKGFQYDLGLVFSFLNRGIEFYMPIAMSKDFKDYYKANSPKLKQKITFAININQLMLHKKIREMKF